MAVFADALRETLAELRVQGHAPSLEHGAPVAARVYEFLEQHRAGSSIVELELHGPWVHVVTTGGEPRYWEIECYSPDDFRLYPGFENGDVIHWANVWVRGSNLTVDELVEQLNDVAFRKEENA